MTPALIEDFLRGYDAQSRRMNRHRYGRPSGLRWPAWLDAA